MCCLPGIWRRRPTGRFWLGDHGSRTSSQPHFVEAVSPTLAIMSLGFENKFKHPAPEVVARYMEHGARVLRTDRTGAVRVRIDGVSMAVETMIE